MIKVIFNSHYALGGVDVVRSDVTKIVKSYLDMERNLDDTIKKTTFFDFEKVACGDMLNNQVVAND